MPRCARYEWSGRHAATRHHPLTLRSLNARSPRLYQWNPLWRIGAAVTLGGLSFVRTNNFMDLLIFTGDGRHIQVANQFALTGGVMAEQVETLLYG